MKRAVVTQMVSSPVRRVLRTTQLLSAAMLVVAGFAVANVPAPKASALSDCVRTPQILEHTATAISPSGLSENLSPNIGEIAPLPSDLPIDDPAHEWDGADRAHDVQVLPGNKALIVGKFTGYTWKGTTYARNNFVIIDTATGQPNSFAPNINGEVFTAKMACDGASVYIGGDFSRVNGAVRNNAARISLTDGSLMSWDPNPNNRVYDIELVEKKLVLAGSFTQAGGDAVVGLVSVNPSTGVANDWMNAVLSDPRPDAPALGFNIVASPDETIFVVTGNFRKVNGKVHHRIAVFKYGATHPALQKWATHFTEDKCSTNKQYEELGLTFAPSSKYFYTAATGGDPGGDTDCDAVVRWPARPVDLDDTDVTPAWINYTDTDSLSGVVATAKSVWVAGHNRWCSSTVGRPIAPEDHSGICEIDVSTGKVTAWHGTTSRQRSMHVRMALTQQGLIYVGDANKLNDELGHNNLGLWTWAN